MGCGDQQCRKDFSEALAFSIFADCFDRKRLSHFWQEQMMSNFILDRKTTDMAEILYLKGFLDAHTAPQLEAALGGIVQNGKYHIVVNFRDLDYISSAGLGVFMVFIEEVRDNQGDIKLVGMTPKVFTVFDLLGFPMLFDILDSEAEALSKFQTA